MNNYFILFFIDINNIINFYKNEKLFCKFILIIIFIKTFIILFFNDNNNIINFYKKE